MIDYRICIPSYKRPKIIKDRTLKLLDRLGIPSEGIDIIVETEPMAKEYNESPDNKYNIIVSNTNGIKDKRNFVRTYYQNETTLEYLICIDDDIEEIYDYDKSITRESFIDNVNTAFQQCIDDKITLWGISPYNNTFFLKKNTSKNLKYIAGGFFGLVIDRNYEPIQTTFNHYEDFCFSVQHFLRDNAVLRLNWLCVKTKYFGEGGITEWYGGKSIRNEAMEKDADRFVELYSSNIAKKTKNKWGYGLKLNHYFKNKTL